MRKSLKKYNFLALCLLLLNSWSMGAYANGDETLGPPVPAIDATGTDIIAAGTGMILPFPPGGTGTINITVPAGVTITTVQLYWEGIATTVGNLDDTIIVDGTEVTGDLIGQSPTTGGIGGTFRADVTGLNLIAPGSNTLALSGLEFDFIANGVPFNAGAGMLVVVDDGSPAAAIDIRDGQDTAYILNPPGPTRETVPQTFTYDAASVDRNATLIMFFSEVAGTASGGAFRPTAVDIDFDIGPDIIVNNALDSHDGQEWDTLNPALLPVPEDIVIPAGSTSITIQAQSVDNLGIGGTPASFVWLAAGLSIPPPPVAALGDRVWEDLNANGIQDCSDSNGNGILGDVDPAFPNDPNLSDQGPECGAGIPNVTVNLLAGDCVTPLGQTADTGPDGFYLFMDLVPGDYCVQFGEPLADFCDTDGFELGEPQFTAQNQGTDDGVDSDADPTTGTTAALTLDTGETNRSLDAGFVCPAKIGDRVWEDTDPDGIQGIDEDGVENITVKLYECTDGKAIITDEKFVRETTTDDAVKDMNYMFGAEPDFDLSPGEYFVQFLKPDGYTFTLAKQGNDDEIDSDCLAPEGETACTTLGSRGINLNRDCGLVPPPVPECGIGIDKKCRVEMPVSGDLACEAKIAATVLEYTGSGTPSVVTVEGKNKKAQVEWSFDAATGILTIDARPEDLGAKMTITTDGVVEIIHTSCSVPYVAGEPAPLDNPKGAPSSDWLVLSFVDKEGTSVSLPEDTDGEFADYCTFTPGPVPSCDTEGKPTSLTFRYTGGACPGDNDQGKKTDCNGAVEGNKPAQITVNTKDTSVDPQAVEPGGLFTITPDGSKFKSSIVIDLSNDGGTQSNDVHTSCSAPLAVGDEFGAITLVGFNGQTGGANVTYQYVVTNTGAPLTDIMVTDDKLGCIAGDGDCLHFPFDLGKGDTKTLTASALISGTTENTGTASTMLGGELCTFSDKVTVEALVPPPSGDCSECDGKVTMLTMQYNGSIPALVTVEQKKDGVVFSDTVQPGEQFTFSGTDKKDTLGTEISIFVAGSLNTKIHTSCSQPIGPGLVFGDFLVIEGYSRNGGLLCPIPR